MTKKDNKEEKEHKKAHKVYKAGDKFHCAECGAEIEYGKNCPTCKTEIDWINEASLRR